MQEMFNKDLEEIKNKQSMIKSTVEGTNSRMTEAEDRISKVKGRMMKINEAEGKREKYI